MLSSPMTQPTQLVRRVPLLSGRCSWAFVGSRVEPVGRSCHMVLLYRAEKQPGVRPTRWLVSYHQLSICSSANPARHPPSSRNLWAEVRWYFRSVLYSSYCTCVQDHGCQQDFFRTTKVPPTAQQAWPKPDHLARTLDYGAEMGMRQQILVVLDPNSLHIAENPSLSEAPQAKCSDFS